MDDDVATPVEDDIVVDHDFVPSGHHGRTVTIESVWATACGDDVSNSLLAAWHNRAAQSASARLTDASSAGCVI
jgi:hypothetical protein